MTRYGGISSKVKEPYLRIFTKFAKVCEAQRFDLRFVRPFRADLSIRKSSIFFPFFRASTIHLGFAPLPAQVSPDGLRYVESPIMS
jgi:hypothetical protein